MNKRNWLLALSLSLAFSPCYADWAKLKAAASDLGAAVSETSKEVWQDVSDFSKKSWASISAWGEDASIPPGSGPTRASRPARSG